MNHQSNTIYLYGDGGIRGNGKKENVASWASVLYYKDNYKELSGIILNSTNNEAELTAVLKGLETLINPEIPITVISDSQYVINGISIWINNWIKNGWKTSTKENVKNKELWIKLLEQKNRFKEIQWIWVKGHDSCSGNNRCDELCNIEMNKYLCIKG